MIQSLASLFSFVKADTRSKGIKSVPKAALLDPVFRFAVTLRVNEYLLNTKQPLIVRSLPLFYFKRLSVRLGFSVPLNVFDEGLAIVHYGLLIVSPAAKIGKNCRVHGGVNIGGDASSMSAEVALISSPTIGDNCYLGPGAKLFGPIVIGNQCLVGANAVVNKSFTEDNLTLAGSPARVISTKGSAGRVIRGAKTS